MSALLLRSSYLLRRILSADVAWLLHRLRLALGLRGLVPRPEVMRSALGMLPAHGDSLPEASSPVRVLVFSHNLDREGASISLKEMVCGLSSRGSITAEIISFGEGPLRAEYEELGLPVKVLPSVLNKVSTLKRLDRVVGQLASLIRERSADVVLGNTLLNFPVILAAEKAGVCSVWNPRESETWDSYFRFLPDPVAQRAIAAIGLPRRVVFVAETTRAVWKDFEDIGNFTVIHNALNPVRFAKFLGGNRNKDRQVLGWAADEIVFLCVGTVCERKGQEDVLLAVEKIKGKLAGPVRFVFAGDISSAYAQRLQQDAVRIGAPDRLQFDFIAATADIGRYYSAADAFMLCSRVESYPRVVLEAMAFGLPIISTPVFGVTEQLPDRNDACFYEPGDTIQLGECVLAVANSSAQRAQLQERIKIRYGKMPTFDMMLDAYEREFRLCGMAGEI